MWFPSSYVTTNLLIYSHSQGWDLVRAPGQQWRSSRAIYGLHSQQGGRGAPLPKLKHMQLGMLAKAALLQPHPAFKPVGVRQRSKVRDSLCQSSANSLGNMVKAAGAAKQGSLSWITVSRWGAHHLTACFGREACDGMPPKGLPYKALLNSQISSLYLKAVFTSELIPLP